MLHLVHGWAVSAQTGTMYRIGHGVHRLTLVYQAFIPAGTPYSPIIYTGAHVADSITIVAGNTLTLNNGTSLAVTGNVNNNTTVSGGRKNNNEQRQCEKN